MNDKFSADDFSDRGVYAKYIYQVLKEIHPGLGISKKAMVVLDSYVQDWFNLIANEASRLARYNKGNTITAREIRTATQLVLPGMLAEFCNEFGNAALIRFNGAVQ